MARRSIAKTAIEGGRAKICRELERREDVVNRRRWKRYCDAFRVDEDAAEPAPEILIGGWDRYRQGRVFADKLRPVRRWLEAQVGRPWNTVRSEIAKKFDANSLAGRHIIDHIDGYVDLPWDPWNVSSAYVDADGVLSGPQWRRSNRWRSFYVDAHGILRRE